MRSTNCCTCGLRHVFSFKTSFKMSSLSLVSKTVAILGSQGSVGAAIATKLAARGANLVLIEDREELNAKGSSSPFDPAVVKDSLKQMGALDVIVNNGLSDNPSNDFFLNGIKELMPFFETILRKSLNPHLLNIFPSLSDTNQETITLLSQKGIAVNILCPKVQVWSDLAYRRGGYTDALRRHCNKPAIIADAVEAMITQNFATFTGKTMDEYQALTGKGEAEFEKYREVPGSGKCLLNLSTEGQREKERVVGHFIVGKALERNYLLQL